MLLLIVLFFFVNVILSPRAVLTVTRGIIVGSGRIGSHLYESNGRSDVLLRRTDPFPTSPRFVQEQCPIYVCTRNDDLEEVIRKTPESKRKDLIFLQNGVLSDLLNKYQLSDNTQALIYYGIAKKDDKPLDGKTVLNPEGLTSVTGIWAGDFAERMEKANLSCKILEKKLWLKGMLEKHIWICAFMAVGVKYKVTVGEVVTFHEKEVRALIQELAQIGSQETGILLDAGFEDRLCAYAKSVASFPTSIKELKWRNGWFLKVSEQYQKDGKSDPTPLHSSIMSSLTA